MKVKLKTLKGLTFDVEAQPDMPIGKVKELAAASEPGKKDGWEAECMKLIHQGKVLENARDLASYSIKEEDFMVVMVSKPKKPAAAPAPAPAPKAGELPAGFFDDKNADLKARGVDPEKAKAESEAKAWAEFSEFAGGVARDELCGNQPVG